MQNAPGPIAVDLLLQKNASTRVVTALAGRNEHRLVAVQDFYRFDQGSFVDAGAERRAAVLVKRLARRQGVAGRMMGLGSSASSKERRGKQCGVVGSKGGLVINFVAPSANLSCGD